MIIMKRDIDPYRDRYLRSKATTNGILCSAFIWYLIFGLFHIIITCLILWFFWIIVDPVGRITETINTTIQQTQPQQQHFTTPQTTEEGTETSDVYEAE